MRITKKAALIVLAFASMLCLLFGAVACGGASAKEAIERYILPQNETLVDADFTLPKTIGSAESPIAVEWKSDNTAAIAIEDGGENYNAKVTLQNEVTPVKLTISAGGNSKDFTVRVDELSVYTFMANYKFAQRKTSVKEDFDLETETAFQGKTATISWEIDEKYNAWINLNETKNKVLVTPGEDIVDVEIVATFSYNGEEATQKYPFSVVPLLEHRQTVNRLYSITDYPLELSGYIVHVVEASESYGNATFYMIDDDFCSGYYCYRVKIDTADIAKYVVGAHVTVSGDTTKNYNGLWENNSGGTAVVDDKAPIDPREKVYAMDTDLLSGVPSLLWHESTFVSLSGWKVASKPDTKPAAADNNLFTLQRGDTKITVRITKYMQRTAEELAALCDVYDAVNVGDFVNVTGILGNFNGFQIQPVLASDITKVNVEGTDENAPKVKAAVNAVDEAVKANFASLIASAKEVTMPTSVDGVTISYKVAGAKKPTVAINGGTFNINPIDEERNYDIEVTYSIGGYEAYGFFKLHNWKQSSEQIVDNVKAALEAAELAEIKRTGEFDLPVVDALGTTITWSVKNSPDWISIADGKIKVTALPAEDTEVTLVATIALDGQTATAELTLKVAAASAVTFKAIDAPAAGDYIFALYQGNLDKWLYANGEISTNNSGDFGATTENPAEAATFTLAASGEGWTIQLKSTGKFLELNDSHRWCYADASTQPWMWNTEAKVLTFEVGGTVYYLGTYGTFDTISASTIDRITGSNLNASGQFVAHFGTMAATELTFKAIETPAAGTYKFAMYSDNKKATYYATGAMSGYYFATSEDVSEAADFVVTQIGNENKYTITVGGKYLEFAARENGSKGVDILMNDTQTEGKYWQWNEAIKNFVFESTYNDEADPNATDLYYFGNYGTYTTLSGNYISRIATKGDDGNYTANGKEGVDQWVAHFGTMVPGGSTTEPEEPEPGPEPEENFKPITAPVAGSEYYMGMKAQDGKYYYLTGAMSNYYMATTTDIAGAKKVTLAGNDTDGWTLQCDGKYIEIVASGTHINAVYNATKSGAWTWDATHSFFTWTVDGSAYALGTYGTFNTVGTVAQSRFDDEGQWFAVLGTYDNGSTTEPEEPEPGPGGDEEHDDEKYGSETAPLSVTQALALANEECAALSSWTNQLVYMTGKIKTIGERKSGKDGDYYSNVLFVDPDNPSAEILAYSVSVNDVVTVLAQNDVVVICGYITRYGYAEPGTIEFSTKDDTIYVNSLKNTRGESAISTEADGATVNGLPEGNKATNGTEITFTVQAEAGKKIVSVKAYDVVLEPTEGTTYKFTLNGDVTIKVEAVGEDEKVAEEVAALGFSADEIVGDPSQNGYANSWDVTRGNHTWTIENFNNNQKKWNFIKTGHKTNLTTGMISTKTAMPETITKVVVTIDGSSKTLNKVKEFKLLIADDAEFSNATEVPATIQTGENEFKIASPAANKFYRIVIDCNAGSANGFVVLAKVSYFGFADGGTAEPEPTTPSEPTTAADIDATGATVFDFSEVQAGADELTDGATLLGMFENAEQAGLTAATGSKVYAGNNTTGGPADYQEVGGFLRTGSSKANGTLTLTFSKNVTKVQILCFGWSASDTIVIDGFNAKTIGATDKVAFIFELSEPVDSFTITTAKRALIFKIAVTFADGGTQPEGPGTTVTFTEDQQGTFQCTMKQIGEEGDPEMNPEDVPALVVSANSIKWGEKTVTILEDMGSGSYLVQIDGENYGLSYTGGWMLTKFGPEEEMLEGYMFGDMGGLY